MPLRRAVTLAVAAIAIPIACFVVLAVRVTEHRPFAWDLRVLHTLHGLEATLHLGGLRPVFFYAADVGIAALVAVLIALIAVRRHGAAAFYALATLLVIVLDQPLKHAFRRHALIGVNRDSVYIFPSGHAMGSMAVATALAYIAWPTRWRWRALLGGIAFVLAVGLAVVVFGAHYPTDVLAGWCLAFALVTALRFAFPERIVLR